MNDCVRITECRLCDSRDLDLIVSFAWTPPGDQYLKTPTAQTYYPLDLMVCRSCGAVQLADTVDPALIYPDYIYTTSISRGLDAHFEAYAASVMDRLQLRADSAVVDIGSNDGTLLQAFEDLGCFVTGVDPAKQIADAATKRGIPTYCSFFTKAFTEHVLASDGAADLITANHIMANVADLHDFIEGVKTLLAPDGTFVFETGYWPAIRDKMLIDTIEHEHIHYFAVAPLVQFFARHGLRLVAVEHQPTKGGSLRGYVRHETQPALDGSVAAFLDHELEDASALAEWANEIAALTSRMRQLADTIPEHECWMGYGAAVGSTLLLHQFGLGQKLCSLIDDNPKRQGLRSPGFHLFVNHPNAALDLPPDRIVILAWRYADRIMAQHPEHAGKWIIPLPTLRYA